LHAFYNILIAYIISMESLFRRFIHYLVLLNIITMIIL
jgi:hypothetical protein